MKKIVLAAVAVATMGLVGCGTTTHMASNHNLIQTNVELSQKNYTVVRTAEGASKSSYVLGIGGLSRKSIKANAQADMYKNANLTGSQAIINPTIAIKTQVYTPLYVVYQVTASGQVIEFTK